jgi:membrane-associated phospholipid phosphatase
VTHDLIRRRLLWLALASAALAVIAGQAFDWPLARWVADHAQSPAWNQIVGVLEYVFGVALWDDKVVPLALAAVAIVTLIVPRWPRASRAWAYLALTNLLARNLMVYGKLLAGRYRPHQWVHMGVPTFGHPGAGTSFPSGHVTVFSALILPVVVVVPRLWPLLVVIPFVMVQRIAVLAHFLSDVTGTLAMVSFVAWLCYPVLRRGRGGE